jgi:hypothetical protein
MASFGEQVELKRELKQQRRLTRTDRLINRDKENKERAERQAIEQRRSQLEAEYQAKIDAYERDVQAQKNAYKLWKKGISYYWYKGKPEYKYLRELWQNSGDYQSWNEERIARRNELIKLKEQKDEYYTVRNVDPTYKSIGEYRQSLVSDIQAANPDDKFYTDQYGNINMIYSSKLGKMVTVEEYQNIPIEEFQKANPNEKLLFNAEGEVYGVNSEQYGTVLSISEYNKRIEADKIEADRWKNIDANLTLGETQITDQNVANVLSLEKPQTAQEIAFNDYSQDTISENVMGWINKTYKGLTGQDKEQNDAFKTVTETKPSATGQQGTAEITTRFDDQSALKLKEQVEFDVNVQRDADKTFENYENALKNLSGDAVTQENVDLLKDVYQDNFNYKYKGYVADYEADMQSGMQKIERDNAIKNWSVVGLGGVREFWYKQQDLDAETKRINNSTKATMDLTNDVYFKDKDELNKLQRLNPRSFKEKDLNEKYFREYTNYASDIDNTILPREIKEYGKSFQRETIYWKKFSAGTLKGGYTGIVDNPRTFALRTGVSAGIVGSAMALGTYSGGVLTPAVLSTLKWVGYGATAVYGTSVIARTSAGSSAFSRGEIFGDIAGRELTPLILGGYIGKLTATKGINAYETWKTMRQDPRYIAPYKRVRYDVLAGDEKFPLANPSRQLRKFREARYSLVTDEKGTWTKLSRRYRVVERNLTSDGLRILNKTGSKAKPIKIRSSQYFRVDVNNGKIIFNKAMKLSKTEKVAILKKYFGDEYSLQLKNGVAVQTKYIAPDGSTINAGSHATTSGRFAKVGERYVTGAGSSELPVQYFSSEDSLYFALGKGQSSSLYGGSLFDAKVPRPYIEANRPVNILKIPKRALNNPALTKKEVITYLKKYAPEYNLRYIDRVKGSYWKEASYIIKRGRTGELIVIGRKGEIEAGKLFGTVSERIKAKPYYTRVSNPEFYRELQAIKRMGRVEYVRRVEKFRIKDFFTPNSLKLKLMDRLMGRKIGQFTTTKVGTVVPIERYKNIPETALMQEQHVRNIKEIKDTLKGSKVFRKVSAEAIEEQKLTTNIKEVNDILAVSSRGIMSSPLTYGEQYASMISFPRSRKRSSPSFSKSYSPSLSSQIRELLSYSGSSIGSSKTSFGGSSSGKSSGGSESYDITPYDYSFTTRRSPRYIPPKMIWKVKGLKEKVRSKRKVTPEIEALFPDFTARAIGLKPVEVGSVNDALREIKKIRTGFEIRTGARVKGYSPIDERSLLKGLMS